VAEVTEQGLYPAEHRALRELHAAGAHVAGHWSKLARRLGGEPVLDQGAAAARELLAELSERTAAHGLHGFPAAQVAGGRALGARGGSDLLLERNQAFRMAVLDMQHTTTLLAYLAELAAGRDDADLVAWHRRWEARLREIEDAARAAAAAQGGDPARAIEPAETGKLGRAGHSLAAGLGTLGEAIDGSPIGRAARRLRR
jgi:Scaffold domain